MGIKTVVITPEMQCFLTYHMIQKSESVLQMGETVGSGPKKEKTNE